MTRSPRWPERFFWGAATSAHQVEGNNADNDWHEWETRSGTTCAEPSGLACDHATHYRDDIKLLSDIGLNCYRFSIEWSRIEPEPGRFSTRWLDHYRDVMQACHDHGLLACVTFHHFTNPLWIARDGAWENPDTAVRFARYCRTVADHCGDLISLAITINEPNIPALLGYEQEVFPPARGSTGARLKASAVFIEAHLRAGAELRAALPDAPVGLALAMADWQALPGGEEEMAEWRRLREDIFLDGTAEDDFVGVNTYTRHRIGPEGWIGNEPGVELTAMGYEFWPQALEGTLRRAAELVPGKPLIVTESGIGTEDDSRRAVFIEESVAATRRAMDRGIDVRGFIYWSALDNFEWHIGYGPRFGLIGVNRETMERTVKPSAEVLGRFARAGAP